MLFEMTKLQLSFNEETYYILISLFCKLNKELKAIKLFEEMESTPSLHVQERHIKVLVNKLSKNQQHSAKLDEILKKYKNYSISIDIDKKENNSIQ